MSLDQAMQSSTYIFRSSVWETARLSLQHALLESVMSDLIPQGTTLPLLRDVLDLACGSGEWVVQFAEKYPGVHVVGIDLDEERIEVARQAIFTAGSDNNGYPNNAEFLSMDVLKPLQFPDASFDYINGRLLFSFMPKDAWGHVLNECYRVLRPGGIIRLIEAELPYTTSRAYEQFLSLLAHALHSASKSFSPTGRNSNITAVQKYLLRQAQFQPLSQRASCLNFSKDEPDYERAYQNTIAAFELLQDFLITMEIAPAQEIEDTYQQVLVEMKQPQFCGNEFFLTTWAQKSM